MSRDDDKVPDWKRLRYPDAATFDRVLKHHADAAYDEGTNDYRAFHALPAWIRLGWPSRALWDRANRTEEIETARLQQAAGARVRIPQPWPAARLAWADIVEVYPARPGVPEDEQDVVRMLRLWPDCFGQPFVDVEITLTKDIITINDVHYGRGVHRVPRVVAADLRRINRDSTE